MKDLDRIRERDDRGGRSPSSVGVFFVVAFGVVFAAGIWVGQRRAETRRARPAQSLAALDGSDRAVASEPLVFQEALRIPSPPSNDVNASIAAVPVSRVAAPSIRVGAPPGAAVEDPSSRGDSAALRPAASPDPEPVAAGADGIFTLHVASYESEPEAQRFGAEMRRKGHHAFLVRTQVEGRGTLYRVRVGPFRTLAEAQRYRLDFEAEMSLPTFIVRRELPADEAPAGPPARRTPTST